MGEFSQNRSIHVSLKVLSTDDTWVDLSRYLTEATVDYGDVSKIGTAVSDSVVRTLNFSIKNDIEAIYSPTVSEGAYEYYVDSLVGDGRSPSIYNLTKSNILHNTVRMLDLDTEIQAIDLDAGTITFADVINTTVKIQYFYFDDSQLNDVNTADFTWDDLNVKWDNCTLTWDQYDPLLQFDKTVELSVKIGQVNYRTMQFRGDGSTTSLAYGLPSTRDANTKLGSIAGGTTITGSGTSYTTEFTVGQSIQMNGETRVIDTITSDTIMDVTVAFTGTGSYYIYEQLDLSGVIESTPRFHSVVTGDTTFYTSGITPDYDNNEMVFTTAIPNATEVLIQYSETSVSEQPIFRGILGDEITFDTHGISLIARDESKVLQDALIVKNKMREYVVSAPGGTSQVVTYILKYSLEYYNCSVSGSIIIGTNTNFDSDLFVGDTIRLNGEDRTIVQILGDTFLRVSEAFTVDGNFDLYKKLTTHTPGIPLKTLLQNMLDDMLGVNAPILYDLSYMYSDVSFGGTSVSKVGAKFTSDLTVGKQIYMNGEYREIASITDDENLVVTSTWSGGGTDRLYYYNDPEWSLVTGISASEMEQYSTLWDAMSALVTQIGFFIGYVYDPGNDEWRLTLLEVPTWKTASDFTLDYKTDLYVHQVTLKDNYKRDAVQVFYQNKTSGKIEYVTYPVGTRIEEVRKPAIYTLNKASQVGTSTEALRIAQRIYEDVSGDQYFYKLETPLLPGADIFSTYTVTHPYLVTAGLADFGATHALSHNIDFTGGSPKLRTNLVVSGKLRSGLFKWILNTAREGFSKPVSADWLIDFKAAPPPTDSSVESSGIEKVTYDPTAYAILKWTSPLGYNPAAYTLQVVKASDKVIDNWDKAKTYVVDEFNPTDAVIRRRVNLTTGEDYYFRVASRSKTGQGGGFDDPSGTIINAIGDNVAPNAPSGLSLTGLNEKINVSFTANSESDLYGYKIYRTEDPASTDLIYDTATYTITIDGTDLTKVTGVGTTFTNFTAGSDYIVLNGELRKISTITSDTVLNVSSVFSTSGAYDMYGPYIQEKIANTNKTTIEGLDGGKYFVRVTAFDTSGNESSPSSSGSAIVDGTYLIRSQTDFDNFYNTLSTSSLVTNDPENYNVVKVWRKSDGTPYTKTISSTRYINKSSFKIIGMDNPEITLTVGGVGLSFLAIEADDLVFEGLRITNNINATVSNYKVLEVDEKSTSKGLCLIKNNYLSIGTDLASAVYTAVSVTTNDNLKVMITDNSFNEIPAVDITGSLQSDDSYLVVINNDFTHTDQNNFVNSTGADLENVYIGNNNIVNGQVNISNGDLKNVKVKNNFFAVNTEFSTKHLINTGTTTQNRDAVRIEKNTVIYNITGGAGGYYLVQTNGKSLAYSTITENIAYGDTASFLTGWIDNATGTGLIIANNTNN